MNQYQFDLLQYGVTLREMLLLCGICSIRLLVIMVIFPPTGDNVLHGTTRSAIVAVWAAYVALGQQASLPQLHGFFLVYVCAKEAAVGLVMAFIASPVFWVAEAVGAYVDDLTGYNNVQMTNPSQGRETSLTSTLMSQCAMIAFWTLGGMTYLLGALFESYRLWPLMSAAPIPGELIQAFVLRQTDSLMQSTAKLATPAMLLLLLVDLGLGLISRAAQKLDLVSLSQPIKGAMAVLMLALLTGMFIGQVRDQVALLHVGEQIRAVAGKK
ncbi:type III secretion system export apparatus subunit SctT [Paraburkholderia sediminicola]|uniref:Type III secretion system export apparatus subunit SctT n=1 Tax=Paraburkholderia metrosideri TaxID=580937 RepID=A0ABW9DM00_9BURK